MANIKKVRSQRKKVVSHSIKTSIAEEFQEVCSLQRLIPSHVVERLMKEYIDKNINV